MMKKINSAAELNQLQEAAKKRIDPDQPCIALCTGTGCLAYGTQKLVDKFREEIQARNLEDKVTIRTTGCHGFVNAGRWPSFIRRRFSTSE